jgi:SOS response regulatory protein OraA/RecX
MRSEPTPAGAENPRAGKPDTERRLHGSVLRYLAGRDRTEAQIEGFLMRRGASLRLTRRLLRRLKTQGYVNDAALAYRWAQARLARRPMGRAGLAAELTAKTFTSRTIEQTLDRLYGERGERERATDLLAGSSATSLRDRARSARLLRQRGFDEALIEALIEELIATEPGDS